jgi:hypothetical protein
MIKTPRSCPPENGPLKALARKNKSCVFCKQSIKKSIFNNKNKLTISILFHQPRRKRIGDFPGISAHWQPMKSALNNPQPHDFQWVFPL